MTVLIAGLVIFFAVHSIAIVSPSWRERMVRQLGEWTWKGLYAAAALLGFALIVWGYDLARQYPLVLYTPPPWLWNVALLLLMPVFPLLLATYLPGRIQTAAKHPMLLATKLWATAHLLVNGTLADILLFGSFLVWAVADRISLRHRIDNLVPQIPRSPVNDVVAVVVGLAIYFAFGRWLHSWLIGVPIITT